jgi:hypothetical protein
VRQVLVVVAQQRDRLLPVQTDAAHQLLDHVLQQVALCLWGRLRCRVGPLQLLEVGELLAGLLANGGEGGLLLGLRKGERLSEIVSGFGDGLRLPGAFELFGL